MHKENLILNISSIYEEVSNIHHDTSSNHLLQENPPPQFAVWHFLDQQRCSAAALSQSLFELHTDYHPEFNNNSGKITSFFISYLGEIDFDPTIT